MHKTFMMSALEQAWLGRGACSPNPSVGAVLVQDQAIIAKDWHRYAGGPHAEQAVLAHCGLQAKGATLYVTLEPCNHWGKTPPCVSAIVAAGIACVVYAFKDPNPIVQENDTTKILEKAGIQVIQYPLPEVDIFYAAYSYWLKTQKPWVTVKMAQTLDAKIAGVNGQTLTLSNRACAVFTHEKRSHADVILTSAHTIKKDNPTLTARVGNSEQAKVLAIIDTHLTLSADASALKKALHSHVYYSARYPKPQNTEKISYHPIEPTADGLNLEAVIRHLGLLGKQDVWVEVGAQLFFSFHKEQLVQTTYLYIVPCILGADAFSAYPKRERMFLSPYTVSWIECADNMIACLTWQNEVFE